MQENEEVKSIDTQDMYDRLCESEKEIRTLKLQIKLLLDKLDEVYYAPNMPGYFNAKNSFEKQTYKDLDKSQIT